MTIDLSKLAEGTRRLTEASPVKFQSNGDCQLWPPVTNSKAKATVCTLSAAKA